ncbi:MAG: hypothetical protein DWQ07_15375 [Chloroflexi bacterium]|nr:MAG: hypothetical protein DWQ07_15375 [Chloroflexota bacterium]
MAINGEVIKILRKFHREDSDPYRRIMAGAQVDTLEALQRIEANPMIKLGNLIRDHRWFVTITVVLAMIVLGVVLFSAEAREWVVRVLETL